MISAELLDRWDRCERRFAFQQLYEPRTITALGVIYAALDAALLSDDPEQTAKDATMRLAARKELVLADINKFTTVRHIEALAGIIAVALRERIGEVERVGEVDGWDSALYRSSATLHRIELVSHFDDDRLRSCAHSWRVIGELAALQSPITLTMVVIGAQRGGRRHSPWTKGLLHPVNKALRFAPRNAKKAGFGDTWNQVWREQRGEIATSAWLNQMRKDDVLDGLILSREIAYNPKDHRMIAAREEMRVLAERMESASVDAPMRRSSCDEFGGCPFQNCCYSSSGKVPADFPQLYLPLDSTHAEPVTCKSGPDTVSVLHRAPAAPRA